MKSSSRRGRKVIKSERTLLDSMARTVGTAIGTIAARADRLREKSRTIGSQAGRLVRKVRKQAPSTSASGRRARRSGTAKHKS